MPTTILLTGATSQIGLGLARTLAARGDRVRCLVRSPKKAELLDGIDVERVAGDIDAPESLGPAMAGVEAVLHVAGLASYWRRRAEEVRRVNVDGTRHVLDAARAAGVRRVVLTSSIVTLGPVAGDGHGDETAAQRELGVAYYDTKLAAERMVLGARDLEGVSVNPGIIVGGDDLKGNGGKLILPVYQGRLRAVPPGAVTMTVLDDVVAGHVAALDRGRAGERYVLGGTTGTYQELFARIAAALGRPAPRHVLGPAALQLAGAAMELAARVTGREPELTRQLAATMCWNRRFRSDKAVRELGYRPSPFEAGVEACRRWYEARGELRA